MIDHNPKLTHPFYYFRFAESKNRIDQNVQLLVAKVMFLDDEFHWLKFLAPDRSLLVQSFHLFSFVCKKVL